MISNLKKYEVAIKEAPYLYLEHEKEVLQLAKDAVEFIGTLVNADGFLDERAYKWLKEHE